MQTGRFKKIRKNKNLHRASTALNTGQTIRKAAAKFQSAVPGLQRNERTQERRHLRGEGRAAVRDLKTPSAAGMKAEGRQARAAATVPVLLPLPSRPDPDQNPVLHTMTPEPVSCLAALMQMQNTLNLQKFSQNIKRP